MLPNLTNKDKPILVSFVSSYIMRKTCPVCGSKKYALVGNEQRCAKCHFISKPKVVK